MLVRCIYTGQACGQVDERLHSRCEYVFAQEGKGEETSMDAGLSVHYNIQAFASCVCGQLGEEFISIILDAILQDMCKLYLLCFPDLYESLVCFFRLFLCFTVSVQANLMAISFFHKRTRNANTCGHQS